MTKKQLIEALAPYPDNMDVFIADRKTDFAYGLLNSVTVQDVSFYSDNNTSEEPAEVECIILDEE